MILGDFEALAECLANGNYGFYKQSPISIQLIVTVNGDGSDNATHTLREALGRPLLELRSLKTTITKARGS